MASTACFLHHQAFIHAPLIPRSSSSQHHRPSIKPSKLVCRAQNQPLIKDHQAVQGGVSRRSVVDALIVGSAAIGSALAFVGAGYADGSSSDPLQPTGKQSWPELVGEKGKVAAATIEKENPNVKAVLLLEGSPADLMFNPSRVRVVVNGKGVVTQVPRIG
ncbi:oxygen-evolving enhancer protein 2, chloroplastic-like [Herrania umbratica]|uniref:Oxygen-evolving enhancer protein 2, chloroplastic-like n=1 Tax=Herrania umbratica TaxID=108875 RepID=A0A6J1A7T6_9ROSI|nr:oxygen-evolving enhancer protein 2, chloroplastic-like [Herrania umbratica]